MSRVTIAATKRSEGERWKTQFSHTRWRRTAGRCRIRVYSTQYKTIVVASELPDNPGMSITNAAEELATQVVEHFHIDPERLVWIEHYSYPDEEDFSLVSSPGPASASPILTGRLPRGKRWRR